MLSLTQCLGLVMTEDDIDNDCWMCLGDGECSDCDGVGCDECDQTGACGYCGGVGELENERT